MKICEAIEQVRTLKPNQYLDETLVRWLSDLDGQIWQDLLMSYESGPAPAAYGEKDLDVELLVGKPHEELYVTYLGAKIDYMNGEFERYNNAMMMYNAQRQAYFNAYIRTHASKGGVYFTGVSE